MGSLDGFEELDTAMRAMTAAVVASSRSMQAGGCLQDLVRPPAQRQAQPQEPAGQTVGQSLPFAKLQVQEVGFLDPAEQPVIAGHQGIGQLQPECLRAVPVLASGDLVNAEHREDGN